MVVDTIVVAYALFGPEDFHDEALRVLSGAELVVAPDSLRAELVNVAWQWVRSRGLPLDVGQRSLERASALVDRFVPTDELWESALELAVERDHPAYDTLFVALAAREGLRLATYDQGILKKFPEWASRPAELLFADQP